MLTRMMERLFFGKIDDEFFRNYVSSTAQKNLELVAFIFSIPADERDPLLRDALKDIESRHNERNPWYHRASRNLRKEYDKIHKEINQVLYN